MNFLRPLVVLSILFVAASCTNPHEDDLWNSFKASHKKNYHPKDEAARKARFLAKQALIEAHNRGRHSFTLSHNQFSDMSDEDLKHIKGLKVPKNKAFDLSVPQEVVYKPEEEDRTIAATLDWRTASKCVAPVKNQLSCGSCWAHAAITSLEFSHCRKRGLTAPVILSEQQLVSCDPYDNKCEGGWPTNAWYHLYEAGGSQASSTYGPYTATNGTCTYDKTKAVAKVTNLGDVASNNVTAMKEALNQYGPLNVAIYASLPTFMQYKSGVYNDAACKTSLGVDHAVVVVGYGKDATAGEYWIVRNSWDTTWGNAGYVWMKMGVNMCSIEMYPMFVDAL